MCKLYGEHIARVTKITLTLRRPASLSLYVFASMAELADAPDLKSVGCMAVWVRVPLEVPINFARAEIAKDLKKENDIHDS